MKSIRNINSPPLLLGTVADGIGGTEQVVRLLSSGFASRAVSHATYTPDQLGADRQKEWFALRGVRIHPSSAMNDGGGWKRLPELIRIARPFKGGYANIHYPSLSPSLLHTIGLRMAGVKAITSVHGLKKTDLPTNVRLAYRLSYRTVVTTELAAHQVVESGANPQHVRVINLGVPVVSGERNSKVGTRTKVVIGCMCRLAEWKRVDRLLHACARVPNFAANFELRIAGDGPTRIALEKLAAELGIPVQFVGHTDRVSDFYGSVDLFALLSENEPFGLVYIEAAMHGVPSVACRQGGATFAVLDGVTGWLVDPNDPVEETSKLIQSFLIDRHELSTRGEAAQIRARKEFSEDGMVDEYLKLFQIE